MPGPRGAKPAKATIAAKRNEKADAKNNKNKPGRRKKVKSEDEAYKSNYTVETKKVKDPNAPKKPQTAYFLFMNAKRD